MRLTLPPSAFWSPEFRQAYARRSTVLRFAPAPAKDTSKHEWEQFEASNNAQLAEPLAWIRKRYPVETLHTEIAGVPVGIISPGDGIAPENKHRVLIHLHAGGFVYFRGLMLGQLESSPVASIGRMKVITVDFRQAPDHVYPAATQDVEAIYEALLQQYNPEHIGIFGSSAGGVLAAQALTGFQKKGLPRPGAVGILGAAPPTPPWPYGKGGDSSIWAFDVLPEGPPSEVVRQDGDPICWYMQGADAQDTNAYPGSSDAALATFPPTLLLVGSRETWLSCALDSHTRLLRLGVDATLYVMEGGWHLAHVFAVGTPEAHDANAYVARWFGQRLAR